MRMVPMFKFSVEDLSVSSKLSKQLAALKEPDIKTKERIAQINEEIIETTDLFQKSRLINDTENAWNLNVKLQRLGGEKANLFEKHTKEADKVSAQLFQLTAPAIEALSGVLISEIKRISELKNFEIIEKKWNEAKDPPQRIFVIHHNFDKIGKTVTLIMEAIQQIRKMGQSSLADLDRIYIDALDKIPLEFPLTDKTEAQANDLQDFHDELNAQAPRMLFSDQKRYVSLDFQSPLGSLPKGFRD